MNWDDFRAGCGGVGVSKTVDDVDICPAKDQLRFKKEPINVLGEEVLK
jgi:hypothetical protein